MSIAGSVFYLTLKNNLQKSIYTNLSGVLSSRCDHIETYLKMLVVYVEQLSKSGILEDSLKISDKESPERNEAFKLAMKRLGRIEEANPAIAEFLLMDKKGLVVAASNESSIGLDKSVDSIFLGAQKGVFIKDLYYSEERKESLMAVSAPILESQTGELLGVLTARVRLTDLNNITTSEVGMGKTGKIYIVNERGCMITPSKFEKGAALNRKIETENVRQDRLYKGREHNGVVGLYLDYRGVQVLGANECIPQTQWTVLAEIDAKEIFAPLAKVSMVFLMILFIVPIAGWLLGIFIARLITAPLRRLRKGIEIVGTGNLDHKVDIGTKDEAGQLSRAFDTMTQHLKESTTSIESLITEIAERKKAQEALRESETKYKALFASAAEGIVATDSETRQFRYVNPSACRMFGYTEEELIRLGVEDIHPKEFLGTAWAEFEAQLRGEKKLAFYLPCLRKDGALFYANVSAAPVILDGRKCLVGFFTDTTESKKADEMLKETQEQLFQTSKLASLGQLSAGAAHEINNPLAGIVGFTEATLQDLKNQRIAPEKIAHDLKIVLKNAERCKVIISNLLNFARAKELHRQEHDIDGLLDDALALVEYRTIAQNIKVIKRYEKNSRNVSIDTDQMMQVFINVIANAQNAMPDGGELIVRTWSEGDFTLIEFKDTGIGIGEDSVLRVFDPFFTTREPGQGVGLGLSISYSIMKRHGGSIEAKSDGKNKGASFIIKIPHWAADSV